MWPYVSLVCRVQLLLIVIATAVGIGGDTQTDISYSPILQRSESVLTDVQYRSNTSVCMIERGEHSRHVCQRTQTRL